MFIDEDRILMNSNAEDEDFGSGENTPFRPGSVGVFNLKSNTFESIAKAEETIGAMLWLGDGLAVGFFQSPKVFDVATGRIVHRWPELATGSRSSSIIRHSGPSPSLACDPIKKRFAVASDNGIDVVLL